MLIDRLVSRRGLVVAALLVGTFMSAIDQMVVATAALAVVRDLGGTAGQAGWLVSAYLLTSTVSMAVTGKLADTYGRKPVLLVALGLFVAGSAFAVVAWSLPVLVVARAVQGIGGGGVVSATFAVLAQIMSPRERGKYQGAFGAVFTVAGVLGPVAGGFFAAGHGFLDWRAIFAINLPLGLVAIAVNAVMLPKSARGPRRKLDVVGIFLLVAGVCAVVLAAEYRSWPAAAVGVPLLVAFVVFELRTDNPVLPVRRFADRTFGGLSAGSFLLGVALTGTMVYLTVSVQIGQRLSPTEAGFSLLPLSLGMIGASTVAGWLSSKFGRFRPFILIGSPLVAIAALMLATADSIWLVRAYALVLGLGTGLMQQMFVLGVQNSAASKDLGVATATPTFLRTLGGSLGTALFGALLTVTGLPGVFVAAAAVAALIFGITLTVPGRRLRDSTAKDENDGLPDPVAQRADGVDRQPARGRTVRADGSADQQGAEQRPGRVGGGRDGRV